MSSVSHARSASLLAPRRPTARCPSTRTLHTSLATPPASGSRRATSSPHCLSAAHPTGRILRGTIVKRSPRPGGGEPSRRSALNPSAAGWRGGVYRPSAGSWAVGGGWHRLRRRLELRRPQRVAGTGVVDLSGALAHEELGMADG